MEKLKQVKIKYVTGVGKGKKKQKVEIITLSESRLIRLFCKFKGLELRNGIELDSLIKVRLSKNKAKALKQLKDGVRINGVLYKYLITSPSMMKKENSTVKEKCEALFIANDDYEFKSIFETVDSLNKLKDIKSQDKLCINKDIVARSSLALSGGYYIDYEPSIVILPSTTFKTATKSYYTYIEQEDGTFNFEDKELAPEFDFADGCGFFNKHLEVKLKKALGVNYSIDMIGIRKSGIAVKGLCIKADMHQIFDDIWNGVDNINFEKRKDGCWTKDVFGEWKNISKADIIVNTNMAKWWKNFAYLQKADNKNLDIEIKNIVKNDELLSSYWDEIKGFEVTKINKEALDEYILTNYQVITNCALTQRELAVLTKETEEHYKKISEGDIDAMRLYYNDIAREEMEELSASTKVQKLLQLSTETAKTSVVKQVTNRNIIRALHQAAGGKFFLKGNYKTCMICPITYCNFIMAEDREQVDTTGGLQANQFYVAGEVGNRVINRNPQAVFSETHRIKLVENELITKHFGHLTNELIFFNQADSMASICSGLDYDLDMVAVWDNDILYNSVIEPHDGKHFYNSVDGQARKVAYTLENEFSSILDSSGNFIGGIANITTKLSNQAQELKYIVRNEDKTMSKNELRNIFIEENKDDDVDVKAFLIAKNNIEEMYKVLDTTQTKDQKQELKESIKKATEERNKYGGICNEKFKPWLEERIKLGEYTWIGSLEDDNIIRKYIIEQFYEMKEIMYKALLMSQIAIDAAKTCNFPTKEQMEEFETYKKMKYPKFMYHYRYSSNSENERKLEFDDVRFTYSAMNINAARIQKKLITPANELKIKSDDTADKKTIFRVIENVVDVEIDDEAYKDFEIIYNKYSTDRNKINNREIKVKVEFLKNLEEQDITINEFLDNLDIEIYDQMQDLRDKYTSEQLGRCLIEKNVQSRFVLNHAWEIVEDLILKATVETEAYMLDDNGDIEYKWKKYKKVKVTLKDNKLQLQEIIAKKKSLNKQIIECKLAKIEGQTLERELIIKVNKDVDVKHTVELYSLDGEKKDRVSYIYNNPATKKKLGSYDVGDGTILEDYRGIVIKVNILEEKSNFYIAAIEL